MVTKYHYQTNNLISVFNCQTVYIVQYKSVQCTLADSGYFKNFLYQGGVKSTVSFVFEDIKFKISEGYNQNWCFPDSAQLAVSVLLRQLAGQSGKH